MNYAKAKYACELFDLYFTSDMDSEHLWKLCVESAKEGGSTRELLDYVSNVNVLITYPRVAE